MDFRLSAVQELLRRSVREGGRSSRSDVLCYYARAQQCERVGERGWGSRSDVLCYYARAQRCERVGECGWGPTRK